MKVTVAYEEDDCGQIALTGGGYASCQVDVKIDKDLPPVHQRAIVVHEIVENYCPSWPHDKVDELAGLINEGLIQLEMLGGE